MSKGKKALKVTGIIFGSLIGLIIVLHIILNITFSIQLNNKIAELKAQGKPMTIEEIAPPTVPDKDNAAILYNKAFVLMTSGEGGKPYIPNKERGTENKTIKTITYVESFSDISEWTDEQKREVPKLINSKEIQEIYKLLKVGSEKAKCNFEHNYKDAFEILMPELSYMRDSARLICAKALLEAESGKTQEAFDTLLVGLKISNHLKDEPILISQLVRIACDNIIIECIKNTSDSKGIPPEKTTLIINELSTHTDIEPFIKCMDGERTFGMEVFGRMIQEKMQPNEMGWYMSERIPLWVKLYPTLLFRPMQKKDFIHYLILMTKMRDKYNFPYYEKTQQTSTDEQIEQLPKYCVLTRMITPALDRVRTLATEHQANIDICRIGLALKIYKAKKGHYPENLDSLTWEVLREIPIDPFSGEEFKYSRYIMGFKLYSIGPNMQDNYGTPKVKEQDSSAYYDYDIVWKCES